MNKQRNTGTCAFVSFFIIGCMVITALSTRLLPELFDRAWFNMTKDLPNWGDPPLNPTMIIEPPPETGPEFRSLTVEYDHQMAYFTITFYSGMNTMNGSEHLALTGRYEDMIRLYSDSYQLERDYQADGLYEAVIYSGSFDNISSDTIYFQVPLDYLPDIDEKKVWLYSMQSKDRIPDSGELRTSERSETYLNTPISSGINILANGSFEENDFGLIAQWNNRNLELYRWYLVQVVQPDSGRENVRWVEQVDLSNEARGYGLKSIDYQNCGSFCSTSAVQIVPAQEYVEYVLSADARKEPGNGGTLYLDFLDENMWRIDTQTKGGHSEEWTRQEISAVAPQGTRYIRVILYTNNKAQGVVYWDKVELLQNE